MDDCEQTDWVRCSAKRRREIVLPFRPFDLPTFLRHFLKGEQLSVFASQPAAPTVLLVQTPLAEPKRISDRLDFGDNPTCKICGSAMLRAGAHCFKCSCGNNEGCG